MGDIFDERENELRILTSKPISFIIFGKPGSGKSTLAKWLSAVWKCQLVDGTSTIEQLLKEDSPVSKEANDKLLSGGVLDETFVAEVIATKLNSPEILHYGYVLDCLPSYENDWRSVIEQFEFIKNLTQTPDVIINLKIPDSDLLKRRTTQKVDPLTNEVFIKSAYSPDKSVSGQDGGGIDNDEEGEEENEEEDEEEDGIEDVPADEFIDDLGEIDELQELAPDISSRLVNRSQDISSTVEDEITYYREHILRHVEDYIIQYNQQYVIELDANLAPKDLFRSLLIRLTSMCLPRATAPRRLVTPEDGEEEEEPEGIDTQQFLTQLSETGILVPRFRWRRSQWSRYCPVELAKGNMIPGRMEFSVGLLDKMYSISSAEALTLFYKNPRAYILPPNPRIPCKICVVGPPTSGKSTLAEALAEHYNAMVLSSEFLIAPVMKQAQEKALIGAKVKAKEEVMARLMVEKEALQSQKESEGQVEEIPPITEDHPEIQHAIKIAEEKVRASPVEPTSEMYIEALAEGIKEAEQRRRDDTQDGRSYGGWVVDGFPLTRDHWSSMIESKLLPDAVLYLENASEDKDLLLRRMSLDKGLPDPATWQKKTEKKDEEDSKLKVAIPPEVDQWQKSCSEYAHQWGILSAAIKGSSIDPIIVDCSLTTEVMVKNSVESMESVFQLPVVDVSALDEDADIDDDPVLEEVNEEEGDEDETTSMKRKPWGDTSHFCPVVLAELGVLWPGNQEIAVKYKERLYSFSSDEAKEKFTANPERYIAKDRPLVPPAPRIFLLGPRGSGKTTVGRKFAEKLGIFHVSFREFLQDRIMPKMKKAPLVDQDDFEGEESQDPEEDENEASEVGDDLDEDVVEALNENESEIRSYLLHGDPLSEESLEEYIQSYWNSEPYKSTGFIMEGFPLQGDELRYVCSKGLFPDSVAIFEVEENHVINRLLPAKMEIWKRKRNKREEKRAKARENTLKEWEEDKAKRRADIEEDYKQKKAELDAEKTRDEEEQGSDEEDEDPFFDDYQEQLAELNAEEPPEEEQEEEETEEDFEERTRSSLIEAFEEQNNSLSTIQDVLSELQITCHTIPAGRNVDVVLYSLEKSLSRYFINRNGLLSKCTPIDFPTAKKLLDHGYKQLSRFGYWCPVKLQDQPNTVLPPSSTNQLIPMIHRQLIYFLSTSEAKNQFIANPEKYLGQRVPRLPVPIRLAIVGPPKSGKTTVAQRFASQYGSLRVSIGEAMRRVISQFPNSDLTTQLISYLKVGQTVPDELCVLALERALLDVQCTTRGFILDGWPMTKLQVDLLSKYHVIPVCIVELTLSDEDVLKRAELDRKATDRPYPMHDSPSIILVRSGTYHKHLSSVKEWYSSQYDNWHTVDAQRNKWHVWNECNNAALHSAVQIQQYLIRTTEGNAASINGLCVTPKEFGSRLGQYGHYCPVRLLDHVELVDCSSQDSFKYSVQYKGYYYRTAGEQELHSLLATPEKYVDEESSCHLPPPELLPQRRTEMEVKTMFPQQYEIQGFCPVTYIDGKKRYECLVSGIPSFSVEYKKRLYCCESQEKLEKFMRCPDKYQITVLPVKLPPLKQPVNISSLPMLGYMEQSVATAIVNGLTSVGCCKPKYPFITAGQSALIYLALHLKAYNPRSSTYVREKYHKKLQNFEQQCKLISYLGHSMKTGYKEPEQRPMEFELQMNSFLNSDKGLTECM